MKTLKFQPIPLFFVLSLLVLSASSQPNKFSDCKQRPYFCGHPANISYPFRLPGMPDYCGHPSFEVSCKNNNTNQPALMMNITGKEYRVGLGIDYTIKQIISLANSEFLADTCPNTFTNTTLDLSLVNYTTNDINMTVYFNCTPHTQSTNLRNFSCPGINWNHSYYSFSIDNPLPPLTELSRNCGSVVWIPMYYDYAGPLMRGRMDILGVIQQGFDLSWIVGNGWCKGCEDSGGACGREPDTTDMPTCFCPDGSTTAGNCGTGATKDKRIIIGSVAGGVGFLFICLLLALFFYKHGKVSDPIIFWKKDLNGNQNIETFLEEYGSLAPKRYSYSDVKKVTKGFQEKLGQGGYGTVFKGTLSDGHMVAVKILNESKGDGGEFINEVASIGRTSHVNVVSLLGFCSEGSKRALIYDFMCNGSLEKLLDSENPKTNLDWEKLYHIAIGIARGLEYLHRGCNTRIVHFDIKPHNILLDEDFCPKISDFGLAKLCLKKDSIISIAGARGTIGYIAPEVFSRNFGVVSSKSDVYSYGMMVLEIAGGKKNPNAGVEKSSEVYFPHWIYEHLDQNGDLSTFGTTAESEETVRKMILVGLWCIQTMPQNRPSISRVIEMLEGSVSELQIPPKPYQSSTPLGSIIDTSSIQDISGDDCSSIVHS